MTNAKLDFLQELGNIGAGHATTALSQMLNGKKLELVVPEAVMLSFEDASTFIGGSEQLVAGIYIKIEGDAKGHMAFIMPRESALNLVKWLTFDDSGEFNEMAISTLQEVGNIVITSYLNALSSMTNFMLAPTVPGVAIDMAGAVWGSILTGAQVADTVTVIKTEFSSDQTALTGHIIFLPDEEGFQKIAHTLGLEDL